MLQEFARWDGRLVYLVLTVCLDYTTLHQVCVDTAVLSGVKGVQLLRTKRVNVVASRVDNWYALSQPLKLVLVCLS